MSASTDASDQPSPADTSAPPSPGNEAVLDLDALDGCLSPLRRVLRYAQRGPVRFLDVIGGRFVAQARALPLPEGVDQIIAEVGAALEGLDDLEADEREVRILTAAAAVRRVDQLLGLPISDAAAAPAARPTRPVDEDDDDDEDDSDEDDDTDEQERSAGGRSRSDSGRGGDNRSRRNRKKRGRGRKKRSSDRRPSSESQRASQPADPEISEDGDGDDDGLRYGDEQLGQLAISSLEGAGDVLAALEAAGITTVDHLLQRAPVGEDVVQPVAGAGRVRSEGRVAVGGRVRGRHSVVGADGRRRTHVMLRGAGLTPAVWENGAPDWVVEALSPGARTVLVGQSVPEGALEDLLDDEEEDDDSVESTLDLDLDALEDELLIEEGDDASSEAPPVAVEAVAAESDPAPRKKSRRKRARYVVTAPELATDDGKHAVRLATYGVEGVEDSVMRGLVRQMLPAVARVQDPVPAELLQARSLMPLAEALTKVHTHGKRAGGARSRLAYDEALLAQLGLLWPRYQGTPERGLSHTVLHGQPARVLQYVDAQLTDEQQVAFEEVKRDLRAPTPMRRVLTGEVGAGKGLVALLSAVLVAENKHQVFILAPDQATAEQRFAFTEPLLRELGLVSRLYTEAPSKAQRDAIKRGEVHVLFGALELIEADIECRRLGLVIAGERDVFGRVPAMVEQLRQPRPDLLIITSTPVAQQVLLAAYPTFDHTVLRHLPGQRVPAKVVQAEHRSTAYGAAAEAVERGEQVAVVFPMSRGADVLGVREALHVVSTLEASVFPGKRIKLFHGAMGREERYRVYSDFRAHRLDVLVATTHFEAGPAVPGVSTVIIEQADRMELSRLHRVREHISVSWHEPRCWLITGETPDEAGLEQVRRFADSVDGFSVAAQEFDVRGLDDMVAAPPESMPSFSWLDAASDLDALVSARHDARELLRRDPGLRRGPNLELARYLRARWDALLGTPCPVQVNAAGGNRRRRRRRRR